MRCLWKCGYLLHLRRFPDKMKEKREEATQMRRKLGAWVLTLLAAFSLLLTGCSRSVSVAADAQEEQGPRRLLFVTDDVAQPFSAQA